MLAGEDMILEKAICFKENTKCQSLIVNKYGNIMVIGDLNIANSPNENDTHGSPFGFGHGLDLSRSVFRRL